MSPLIALHDSRHFKKPTAKPTRNPTKRPVSSTESTNRIGPNSNATLYNYGDAVVNENKPNKVDGREPFLEIRGNSKIAVLRFDISAIQGLKLRNAKLVLNLCAINGNEISPQDGSSTSERVAGYVNVDVAPRAGSWEEDEVNWNEASSWYTVNAGDLHLLVDSDGMYRQQYEIDVFPTMKKLLKGTRSIQQSLTFSLSSDSDTGRLSFFSREATNGKEPSLQIELGEEGVSRVWPTDPPRFVSSHFDSFAFFGSRTRINLLSCRRMPHPSLQLLHQNHHQVRTFQSLLSDQSQVNPVLIQQHYRQLSNP